MMEFLIKLAITIFINIFSLPCLPTEKPSCSWNWMAAPSQVECDTQTIKQICADLNAKEFREIQDPAVAAVYWNARSNIYPFIMTLFKRSTAEDITVPRNLIPALVRSVQEIAASVGIMIGLAGHAGDGNMHPTILQTEINDESGGKSQTGYRPACQVWLGDGRNYFRRTWYRYTQTGIPVLGVGAGSDRTDEAYQTGF
jgi:glycolate oxidase